MELSSLLGAVDEKHIVMQCPLNAGSYYYNYKGTHSIVLMAVAGPDYECFMLAQMDECQMEVFGTSVELHNL